MSHRVAIVGGNGQLAHDLLVCWRESRSEDEVLALTHAEIEVADLESVQAALGRLQPQLVINTSAYHKVDQVEADPGRAFAVNSEGVRNLALACSDLDAVLVHMSTDYVFAGDKGGPYVETDPVDAVNVYGVSKAAGEMLLRYLWPKHFIVRTSGLYGTAGSSGKGGNFVELMLRLASERKPIRVVNDQILTPTGTAVLAGQILTLTAGQAYGTYHATCQGECSWFEFATEVFQLANLEASLSPQTTLESGARARRPHYSVLENHNLRRLGRDVMPHWKESLRDYLLRRPEPRESV